MYLIYVLIIILISGTLDIIEKKLVKKMNLDFGHLDALFLEFLKLY